MLEQLYENIGKKIKVLAIFTFIIEAIAAIIFGLFIISKGPVFFRGSAQPTILYGFLIAFFGPIVSFVLSWFLYSWGELVDKTCYIAEHIPVQKATKLNNKKIKFTGTEENSDEAWLCSECGFKNKKALAYCPICGNRPK